jgi:hypothetical protein
MDEVEKIVGKYFESIFMKSLEIRNVQELAEITKIEELREIL